VDGYIIGGRLVKKATFKSAKTFNNANRTASAAHICSPPKKILQTADRLPLPITRFHTLVQSKATFGRLKQFAEEFYRLQSDRLNITFCNGVQLLWRLCGPNLMDRSVQFSLGGFEFSLNNLQFSICRKYIFNQELLFHPLMVYWGVLFVAFWGLKQWWLKHLWHGIKSEKFSRWTWRRLLGFSVCTFRSLAFPVRLAVVLIPRCQLLYLSGLDTVHSQQFSSLLNACWVVIFSGKSVKFSESRSICTSVLDCCRRVQNECLAVVGIDGYGCLILEMLKSAPAWIHLVHGVRSLNFRKLLLGYGVLQTNAVEFQSRRWLRTMHLSSLFCLLEVWSHRF
jgi:hypothetical protein